MPTVDALISKNISNAIRNKETWGGIIYNVKDYGAKGDGVTDDTSAFESLLNDINDITGYITVDLGGRTYSISRPIKINRSQTKIQNGTLIQTTETEDVLQIGEVSGNNLSNIILEHVQLKHSFNTANTGNLLHIQTGLNNSKFIGRNSIWSGGFYGVRSHGTTWHIEFEGIWINDTYSSAWYMPASGDVIDDSALGGSTTTKLTNCHATYIKTEAPAYHIGNGYDTVILDTCSADNVTKFGDFKCHPLKIMNCSSENIRNPEIGSLTNHIVLNIKSGYGVHVDGFHVTFDDAFISPSGTKAFIQTSSVTGLKINSLRGSTPSDYYTLRQEGGTAEYQGLEILGSNLGILTFSGGSLYKPHDPHPNRTLSGNYQGSGTQILFTPPSGNHIYLITFQWTYSGEMAHDVWILAVNGTLKSVTKLSSGPDYSTAQTLDVDGSGNVTLTNSTGNLTGTWRAFELSMDDY